MPILSEYYKTQLRDSYQNIGELLNDNTRELIEDEETVIEVEKYRWDFKPDNLKGIILAESHVYWPRDENDTALSYENRDTLIDNDNIFHANAKEVGLIYCPRYGDVNFPVDADNNRTRGTDYWPYIFWPASGREPGNADNTISSTAPWDEKHPILESLIERGIWLLDASPIAIYLGNERRLNNTLLKSIINQHWNDYLYDLISETCPIVIRNLRERILFVYERTQDYLQQSCNELTDCRNLRFNKRFKKDANWVNDFSEPVYEWANGIV